MSDDYCNCDVCKSGECGCRCHRIPSADERAREIVEDMIRGEAWRDGLHMNDLPVLRSSIAAALKEADAEGFKRGLSERFNKTYRICLDLDVTMFADNHVEVENTHVLKVENIRTQRGQEDEDER